MAQPNEENAKITNEASTEAEKLNLRREIRRRKILNEGKERLDKLNGRINTNLKDAAKEEQQQSESEHLLNNKKATNKIPDISSEQWSDPEVTPDPIVVDGRQQQRQQQWSDPEVLPDPIVVTEHSQQRILRRQQQSGQLPEQPQQTTQQPSNINFDGIMNLVSAFNSIPSTSTASGATATATNQRLQNFFMRYRAHIILSSLLSYIISIFSSSRASSYSAFIPIGLCLAIELMYFRPQQQVNPLIILLFTLAGFHANKVTPIIQILQRLQSLATDLGIFIFIYCSLTYLLVVLNKRFVDFVKIA